MKRYLSSALALFLALLTPGMAIGQVWDQTEDVVETVSQQTRISEQGGSCFAVPLEEENGLAEFLTINLEQNLFSSGPQIHFSRIVRPASFAGDALSETHVGMPARDSRAPPDRSDFSIISQSLLLLTAHLILAPPLA